MKRIELHEKINYELSVVKLITIVWMLLRLDYDLSINCFLNVVWNMEIKWGMTSKVDISRIA